MFKPNKDPLWSSRHRRDPDGENNGGQRNTGERERERESSTNLCMYPHNNIFLAVQMSSPYTSYHNVLLVLLGVIIMYS